MSEYLKIILYCGALYLAVVALMHIFQRRLMYMPSQGLAHPKEYGLSLQEIYFSTRDNIKIAAWFYPAKDAKETIVYFHGNLGNLGTFSRHEKFRAFMDKGFGVLAISYRGYGKSEGSPHESGLYHDARAALDWLIAKGVPQEKIVLFGESLGTGVAVQMATEYKHIRALVLEAPYTSVLARAAELHRWVPVKYLLKDKFDSIGKITNVKAPLLILHGELDATIPIAHGRKLLAAANEPKKGVFYPHVHHIDFAPEDLAREVESFLRETL